MASMTELKIENGGRLTFKDAHGHNCSARFDLLIIQKAWYSGCSFEAEADGFGPGQGTKGDWSGIRDSSAAATAAMFIKALDFGFPNAIDS